MPAEDLLMDTLLKDMVGFVGQYILEIVLWLIAFALAIAVWYMLWPIEQLVITSAVTVAYLGAVASAQSSIVTFLKSRGKSHRKKK